MNDGIGKLKAWAEAYGEDLCVLCDEPMSRHTSFRIGGPAALFLIPKTQEAFCAAIRQAREW